MHEYEAGIIHTERRGPSYLLIELDCPDIARTAVPGQFVQVRVSRGADPFLRRTFSISGCDQPLGAIRLAVDVVGRGTELLCSEKRGGSLNIIGPLGKGFGTDTCGGGRIVLVAGGIGAAPLLFLAGTLAPHAKDRMDFIMGARTAAHHTLIDRVIPDGVRVLRATDDGSLGRSGTIEGPLRDIVASGQVDRIVACGPAPMLAAVASIASGAGIPCEVSLEERMACGLGACLGCAVRLTDGRMARSCVDGPVFDALEVAW